MAFTVKDRYVFSGLSFECFQRTAPPPALNGTWAEYPPGLKDTATLEAVQSTVRNELETYSIVQLLRMDATQFSPKRDYPSCF